MKGLVVRNTSMFLKGLYNIVNSYKAGKWGRRVPGWGGGGQIKKTPSTRYGIFSVKRYY